MVVDNKKIKVQKYHRVMSVMEAYRLFKRDNPTVKVGKSNFAKLPPKNVLLTSQLPRTIIMSVQNALKFYTAAEKFAQIQQKISAV